jgi:cell shape-determining protein MreD
MIYLGILISIILEASFLSIPILIPIILSYFIFTKNSNAFFLAFASGILIDTFLLNPIGISSIYFCIILFLVFLYSKKFEIESLPFISIFTILASSFYIAIFSSSFFIAKTFICTAISVIIYFQVMRFKKKTSSSLVK